MERNDNGDERFKSTGKEKDAETDFNYFGARYYDAEVSVWLSVDPMAVKYPEISPYTYVFCNPLNYIDYWGLEGDPPNSNNTLDVFDDRFFEDGPAMWDDNMGSSSQIQDVFTTITSKDVKDSYLDSYIETINSIGNDVNTMIDLAEYLFATGLEASEGSKCHGNISSRTELQAYYKQMEHWSWDKVSNNYRIFITENTKDYIKELRTNGWYDPTISSQDQEYWRAYFRYYKKLFSKHFNTKCNN